MKKVFHHIFIVIILISVIPGYLLGANGKIKASMYAVPADTLTGYGTTTISWTTSGTLYCQLWVTEDLQPETFISSDLNSTTDAAWISEGSRYVFKLYNATGNNPEDRISLLDSILVVGIPAIQPMVGQNKMDLFLQYLCSQSGCDGTPEYINIVKAMARKSITDAAMLGTKYMRVAVSGFSDVEVGIWQDNPAYFWSSMDEMISDLKNSGIKLIPSLVWNEMQFPWKTNTNFRDYITDTSSSAYKLSVQFMEEFINRYKNDPVILFWELNNEMNLYPDIDNSAFGDPLLGNITTDEMIAYNARITGIIRNLDPYHMITSGYGCPREDAYHLRLSPQWLGLGSSPDDISEYQNYLISSHEGIDIVCMHPYNSDNERFGYTGHFNTQYIDIAKAACDSAHKYFFLGEIGDVNPYSLQDPTCQFTQNVLDRVLALNIPFSAPWVFEFYPGDTYSEDLFNIDPPYTIPMLNKVITVNNALGNTPVQLQDPDITKPVVLITWPLNGRPLELDTQMVYAKTSDNNHYIDRVELWVDGTYQSADSIWPFQFTLLSSDLPVCDHKIILKSFDIAGNCAIDSITSLETGIPCGNASAINNNDNEIIKASIFPDPVTAEFNLSFRSELKCNYLITVQDVFGRIIYRSSGTANAGNNILSCSAEDFAQGIYFLALQLNGKVCEIKFVVSE